MINTIILTAMLAMQCYIHNVAEENKKVILLRGNDGAEFSYRRTFSSIPCANCKRYNCLVERRLDCKKEFICIACLLENLNQEYLKENDVDRKLSSYKLSILMRALSKQKI